MTYYRNLSNKVNWLLTQFPAVVILGARQTGKTTLARQLGLDWTYLDMENPDDADKVLRDPVFYFRQQEANVIIDEAQESPELLRVLRGVIDEQRNRRGRFILTGSSSPDLKQEISESLAGRVALVELGTLKANEYYERPLSTFYEIFSSPLEKDHLPLGPAPISNQEMQKIWLLGGYPEPLARSDPDFHSIWMENYRDTYIHRDIANHFPRMNRLNYRRFLTILAKLSGNIINKSELARALEVSQPTVTEYIDIAAGTFLWRNLLSYENSSLKSLVKMPKGYIRDPGILHYLLNVTTLEQLYESPWMGSSFEGFVIEELSKGLNSTRLTNWDLAYYRTRAGAEVDIILKGPFGILPIEVKFGTAVRQRDLRSLSAFIEEQQLPFGLVINQSEFAEWVAPKIFQLPVGWL